MCLSFEIPAEVRKIVRGCGEKNLSKEGRQSTVVYRSEEEEWNRKDQRQGWVGRRGYGEGTANTNALLESLMETYYYGSSLKYTHTHTK